MLADLCQLQNTQSDVICTTFKGRMPTENAGKDSPCKSHDHSIPCTLETAYDCVLSINYFYNAKNIYISTPASWVGYRLI